MTSAAHISTLPDSLDRLHEDMARACLAPTWKYVSEFVSVTPRVSYRPFLWKWDYVLSHLMRAGELITPERGSERRSMEHTNPDLRAQFATSHTIATALQLVRAGECAPPHRHMASAVRFAARSRGGEVFTVVEGEPLRMEENDLLLTPAGTWHEHRNNTPHDIVWLDALDFPLVNLLQASWFEPGHEVTCEAKPEGYTEASLGWARPAGWQPYPEKHPTMRYSWRQMRAALERLRAEPGSPFDGIILEYINPLTSGPTLPTMSCRAQMLRPHEHTRAHRALSSTVCYVVEGRGTSIIEGQAFEWERGDVFVIPNWHWHEHRNDADQDALLFSITDEPVTRLLGMYREEAFPATEGRQTVTGRFEPSMHSDSNSAARAG